GETLAERAETISAVAALTESEHVQEVIVQNFRAKAGTRMAAASEPSMDELLRAVAVTRLACGPRPNVQAPPNLAPDDYGLLARAGINDWGGVSPVTMDYVNPEAPWPQVRFLELATRRAGSQLVPRLCVYPEYVRDFETAQRWLDPAVLRHVLAASDGEGLGRVARWWPADQLTPPATYAPSPIRPPVAAALSRAARGERLEERGVGTLVTARGEGVRAMAARGGEVSR